MMPTVFSINPKGSISRLRSFIYEVAYPDKNVTGIFLIAIISFRRFQICPVSLPVVKILNSGLIMLFVNENPAGAAVLVLK